MDCAVVVVGDELLAGHTADANGPFLATRLRAMGHQVVRITVVPDEEDIIIEALEDGARRAPFVCICGGLGPTHDDVTIDSVASFLSVPLETPPEARKQIERIYAKGLELGYLKSADVDEGAWRMARVPQACTVVLNNAGAAPGSFCTTRRHGRDVSVLVLPGPPGECRSVFESAVAMRLIEPQTANRTVEVHLKTFEAPIAAALLSIARKHPTVKIGSYPQSEEKRVVVRITGPGEAPEAAAEAVRARFKGIELPPRPGDLAD